MDPSAAVLESEGWNRESILAEIESVSGFWLDWDVNELTMVRFLNQKY
jgi:hypothetical protein